MPLYVIALLKIFSSSVEFAAVILLTLSLFRIPLRYNYLRVFVIGILLATISYYFRDFANLMQYTTVSILAFEIILVMLFFKIPFLFSLLISITGFLAAAIIEYGVVLIGVQLNLTAIKIIETNNIHYAIIVIISAFLMSLLTFILQYKKIGFMFVSRHFRLNQIVKGYNFILSAVLLVCVLIMQAVSFSYSTDSIHIYFLMLLFGLLLVGLLISYRQNIKLLKEKMERFNHK